MDAKRITSVIGGAVAFVRSSGRWVIHNRQPDAAGAGPDRVAPLGTADGRRKQAASFSHGTLGYRPTRLRLPSASRGAASDRKPSMTPKPVIAEPSPPPMPDHEAVPPDVRAKKAAKAPVKAERHRCRSPDQVVSRSCRCPAPLVRRLLHRFRATQPPSDGRSRPARFAACGCPCG